MSKNLKKMISYYKPYLGVFWADMFFATVSAAVALVIPLVIRYVTSTLIYMEPQAILGQIRWIALMLFALVAVDCYSRFFIANQGHVMGAKIEYDMRAEIFAHFQKLSFSFYDDQKVGQLMSRITTDLFDITELMHHGPENIILSLIKIIGAFVILMSIKPALALAAFAVLPFMFLFAYYMNGKMRRAFRSNRERIADINAQIEDNLSGIRVVKSFANEDIEKEKFRQGNEGFLRAKKNSYYYMGSFSAGLGTFTTLIQVNVILAGVILIAKGSVDISDLVTFLLYISVFTEPVRTLIDFTEQFQNGYTGFERFQEIMAIEPDIADKEDAKELVNVKGDISFEDVSFQYEENTECVLNHINLNVPAGAYMALVGSSGAGKSTLCSLIPRFYDVTAGAVKIDGCDVRDIRLKSLRDHIGIVQQDVYLFVGTVFDNIRYGKPDATREDGSLDERPEELPFDLSADVIEITDADYAIWYMDCMDNPKKYEGKKVSFLALVYNPEKLKKGVFVPGRFAMTCCIEDVTFIGFKCKYADEDKIPHKSWINITAEVHVEFAREYKGKGPVLYPVSIEPAEKPEDELVYFS